jgi:hypothetical protein
MAHDIYNKAYQFRKCILFIVHVIRIMAVIVFPLSRGIFFKIIQLAAVRFDGGT